MPRKEKKTRKLESSHHRHDDEECDILYTKCLRTQNPKVKLTVSRQINRRLLERETWKCKKSTSKRPRVGLLSATVSGSGIIGMIDTIDRPPHAEAEGFYARRGKYEEKGFKNKPGERIPKARIYAEAGVGRASAEFSVFRAEAKGPNASVSAEVTAARLGAGAMAQAEIGSASASAGPLEAKLGLGTHRSRHSESSGYFFGTGFSDTTKH
ncbi:hypothetical protein Q8A67_016968 [Cirrhinus molitorella]|uniref:Uncharacterized protein n=1 Tax=Cirrhinus molitorella TaxID=172907 RepID=A0AA88PDW6_9TELE|nr:hypothetical protein Q8A67_016968 [Cirrhinus molitorella]